MYCLKMVNFGIEQICCGPRPRYPIAPLSRAPALPLCSQLLRFGARNWPFRSKQFVFGIHIE